ncbi:hypothetical protein [Glutamicibacter sp. TV12E]|uniref:hypothetical protein n=1 Tax=Glutamicibacter sp. TV12E TaxID=3446362 RepID=UPI004033BE74
MHVLDHFPEAHLIESKDLREGDVIAYTPAGQANSFCVAVYDHCGPGGQKYTSDGSIIGPTASGFHLIDRPKPAAPTIPGSMIRITDSVNYPSNIDGEVLTCNSFGDFIGPHTRLGRHSIKAYKIAWEQVWYTLADPDDVVDAQVIDDETPQVPLPVAPGVLVHILNGAYRGALMRCELGGEYFHGVLADGGICGMPRNELEKYDWEAVKHLRNQAFHADPAF